VAGFNWSFLVPSREKGLPVVWKGAPILGMSASQGSETEATLGKGVTYARGGCVSHLLTETDIIQVPEILLQPFAWRVCDERERKNVYNVLFVYL